MVGEVDSRPQQRIPLLACSFECIECRLVIAEGTEHGCYVERSHNAILHIVRLKLVQNLLGLRSLSCRSERSAQKADVEWQSSLRLDETLENRDRF